MPTRTLGDLYLKKREFAHPKVIEQSNLFSFPYISDEAELKMVEISENDR